MNKQKATFAASPVAFRVYDLLIRTALRRLAPHERPVQALGSPASERLRERGPK